MFKLHPLLAPALLLFMSLVFAQQAGAAPGEVLSENTGTVPDHALPVYHIPLRIHLNESSRSPAEFRPMLEEINEIWLSQAGICFEMEVVLSGEPASQGIDLWFEPLIVALAGGVMNGYYQNDHAIHVRDTPLLGPASNPARYPAARTAAHELGHSLGLSHRQDSNDNLMRSQTFGWKLNTDEIRRARETAGTKFPREQSGGRCRIRETTSATSQ